jgi:hypothetical protein
MRIIAATRILYPAKLTFKIDGGIKVFHDKQKLKQYITTKLPLQNCTRNSSHRDKSKQNHKRMGSIQLQEKNDK